MRQKFISVSFRLVIFGFLLYISKVNYIGRFFLVRIIRMKREMKTFYYLKWSGIFI